MATFLLDLSNVEKHMPKVFRIAEMYLIAAEAGAKTGAADALTTLNKLRTARGIPALVGLTGTPLLDAVKNERFLELAFEGFRLLDLKRWHQPVVRSAPQNINMLNTGADYIALSKAADDPQFVWGLPSNDIAINKNLVQNGGW